LKGPGCLEPIGLSGGRPDETALEHWFSARAWSVQPFQRRVWQAMRAGESGLLHAGTGSGKTLAVWLGAQLVARPGSGLRVLWVTPMRALATDTCAALEEPLAGLGSSWRVGLRTSDTGSSERQRQLRTPPQALVTTPESLSLLIAQPASATFFASLELIVVDEWHELIGSKRGVQVQLAMARLRQLSPGLLVWGLSATLARPEEALAVLTGGRSGRLVRAPLSRPPLVDTLIPESVERFPWAGHLGARMRDAVIREIEASASALVFCNTRAQAEIWYQMLLEARPDWAGLIALHHGSLDASVRRWVEEGIAQARLRAVVCTSTLDLGVDFAPVDRVLQIGSAKGVARLLQRAGRSGHRPGGQPRVTLVPTHSLELLEAAAARQAIAEQRIEPQRSPERPLDVLVQHLVTVALAGGFDEQALLAEVRSAWAYRELSLDEWNWAMDFVVRGGSSLRAYPAYHKLVRDPTGRWRVEDTAIARRHRQAIGTIVADAEITVRSMNGARLGSVEESFISRLKPGDCFVFAGRVLELARFQDMVAWVRRARDARAAVSRWAGSRMPLSSQLADAMLEALDACAQGWRRGPELAALRPLLALQQERSRLPGRSLLLVESMRSREGFHLFVYPFAGRAAHLGLASLIAWRLARREPATYSIAVNDYGLELLAREPFDQGLIESGELFTADALEADCLLAVNAAELVKRRFRETARIAGLLIQGGARERISNRSLQASAGLFYEVFARHDPANLLLEQARREVLERELELERIRAVLDGLRQRPVVLVAIERPTPFAFPLMVERLRERLSTEALEERIARLIADAERP
jgi:ATP-dependent Lhr-like helicase